MENSLLTLQKIASFDVTFISLRYPFGDTLTAELLVASSLRCMRQTRLTILLLLIVTISRAQQSDFDLKDIKFKGLGFSTTKADILKSLGQAKRVETNYECGFFTNDQEGGPYYQLVYSEFNYIGSDNEKFFYLENVFFDLKGSVKIDYIDKVLTGQTTEEEFIKMFGEKVRSNFVKHQDHNTFLLYSKGSDDGALFVFRNGRLSKFEYWTPC